MYLRLQRHTVERALSDYAQGTSQGRRQLGDGTIFMASGWPGKGHGALLKSRCLAANDHKSCLESPNVGVGAFSWVYFSDSLRTSLQAAPYLAIELLQERVAALGTLLVVAHFPKLLRREAAEPP